MSPIVTGLSNSKGKVTFNNFIGYSKQGYIHLTGIYKRKHDLIDFFQTINLFSFYRLRGSENFHYPLVYKMGSLRPWRDFYGFLGRY